MRRILGTLLTLTSVCHISFANDVFNWQSTSAAFQTEKSISSIGEHFVHGQAFSIDKSKFNTLKAGDSFTVNLPDKRQYQATVNKIKNKSTTKHIVAYINDNNEKLPVIFTFGDKQFFARIVAPQGVLVAQGHGNSGKMIEEQSISPDLMSLKNDVKIPTKSSDTSGKTSNENNPYSSGLSLQPLVKGAVNSNESATVDVLFVYSVPQETIDEEYGGDILTRINHIIEVTNQIYIDSEVDMQIAASDIISVDYPVDNDSDTALDDITFGSHEAFTDIETIRYEKGADMVALLRLYVDGDSACGLAWGNASIYPSASYMYSHTSIDCGDYVNAHELGHNMGLAHSRAQGDTGYTFPYALGHRVQDPDNGFSSVMAYSVENAGKIYKLSNPDILCTELPCGIDRNDPNNGADASFALNQVRFQLENLFDKTPDLTLVATALESVTDANLKQCLTTHINSANITYANQLNYINCSYRSINSLQGLESFSGLTTAYLNNNNITDISPLSSLIKLDLLSLSENTLGNINSLSALTGISSLYLEDTNISDISPLANMSLIDLLWIPDNQISDLSPLSNMPNLYYLYASSNNILSLSPLQNNTALKIIYVGSNEISDLSPLSNASKLEILHININNISDLTPLTGHQTLRTLSLNGNSISSIAPLVNLPSLQSLNVSANNLTTLPALTGLGQLVELDLGINTISDIAALAQIPTIENLTLRDNPISDISDLSQLNNLNSLDIANTDVSEISTLASTIRLSNLDLQNSDVVDISALFSLHNDWGYIRLTGLNNIKCWQQEYVNTQFTATNVFTNNTCSSADDNNDFDGDTISNAMELNNGTNPIYHNSEPGVLHFRTSDASLTEGGLPLLLKVVRSQGNSGAVSIDIKNVSGTAKAGEEFLGNIETLTFNSEELYKDVYIESINDTNYDGGKVFTVELSNPSVATIGDNDTVTVTIIDDDYSTITWQTNSVNISEDISSIDVSIQRPAGSIGNASVTVSSIDSTATNNVDYVFPTQTVEFSANEFIKTLTVDIIDNALFFGDQIFYLSLSNPSGARLDDENSVVTINIIEDESADIGNVSFTQSARTVGENAGNITLNLERLNGSSGEITVDYIAENGSAANNNDYQLEAGSVTFAPGETEKSITVAITDDSFDESNETFSVTISAENSEIIGETATITVTITDNDTTVTPPTTGGGTSSGGGGGGSAFYLLLLIGLLLPRRLSR